MATEKTLNTRIKLRYDLYSNWSTNNPKLLAGEVALAYIPTGANNSVAIGEGTVSGTTPPQVLIKVGDGEHNYNDLKYVSALAADVLSACKTEAGLTAFINNVIAGADMATNEKFTELSGKVDTLNGDASTAGSVAKAIKDAIDALDLANTYATQDALEAVNTTVGQHSTSLTGIAGALDNLSSNKADKAETLAGYGITDAYTKEAVNTEISNAISDSHDTLAGIYATQEELAKTNETVGLHTTQITGISGAIDQLWNKADVGSSTDASSANTIYGAKKYAEEQVDALEEDMGSVDGLSTTNKTVVGAINEVLAAVGTGGTAAVVTVEKSADGLTYTVKQGNATVGTIDIPKDMVVTAGEVVTNPEGQAEGTYIKLTLANVTDPLYINVGTLVDIYKAQASATQVQIAIDSSTREISATIVAGSIGATELADNAVVTAKIADANVTKAKLSTEVQTSLGLADSAVQEADLGTMAKEAAADYVKKSEATGYDDILTKTEAQGAYQPKGEYYTKTEADAEFTNATEVDGQIDAKIAELDLANTYQAKGEYATAEQGGKADTAIQSVTSVAGNGIKATTDGTAVTIDWDSEVVLIFDCGNSGVTA